MCKSLQRTGLKSFYIKVLLLCASFVASSSVFAIDIRINTGGGQYTDGSSNVWSADTGFNTGSTSFYNVPINGTVEDALYQTHRWDGTTAPELTYSFSVPNGDYSIKLHFAEKYAPTQGVGLRVFDVLVENVMVLDNMDVFAEAGADTALVKTLSASVADGQLNIEFLHEATNNKAPIISAIEILEQPSVPDTEAPTIPQSVTATAVGDSQIDISWTASTDMGGGNVAGYKIFRDGNSTAVATVTGTSYSDTGLAASTLYSYTVSAFDNAVIANESVVSSAANATTAAIDTQAPTVPTGVAAVAISTAQIDISWTASTDVGGGNVAGYKVFRDGNSIAVATVAGTSYSDTGLAANTLYTYTVSAFDNAAIPNESLSSSAVNATTLLALADPVRLNAGDVDYTDGQSQVWLADASFVNTGVVGTPNKNISGTVDQPLYAVNRYDQDNAASPDEMKYSIPVVNGTYTVRLYFAETFNYGVGLRVFDVLFENLLIIDNLDIFSVAGADTAHVEEVVVYVNDGILDIQLNRQSGNPIVSAIEVLDTPTAIATPTISPNGGAFFASPLVVLESATTGANIYYTLDGSTPTLSSTLYTGPFMLAADSQVRAKAFKDALSSSVSSANFVVMGSAVSYDFTTDTSGDWTVVDDSTGVSSWNVVGGEFVQSNERGIVFNGAPTDAPSSFDGTYHLGTYAYLASGLTWTDYRVSLDMTPIEDPVWAVVENGHDIGVMFRYTDINNYYRLSMNSAYGFSRLEKKVGGVFTTLAVDSRGYPAEGQLINISVDIKGDLIQVFIDGEARYAAIDASLTQGSVALYTQDGAKFDNVVVNNNSNVPSIVIADPLSSSVTSGNQLSVSAIAMNIPVSGTVEIDVDGTLCAPVTEASPGYFTAPCPVVSAGDHTVTALLKDGAITVASDVNALVGTSGDVYIGLGDSITNGIGDKYESDSQSSDGRIVSSQGYEALLHDLLNTSEATPQMVHDEGISGDTSSKLLNLRILSILERRIDATKALVMLGTNDSGGSIPIPSGLGCSGNGCNGTYKGNMQAVIDLLNASGVSPVIALPPPNLTKANALSSSRNALLQDYITVINTELTGHQVGPDFYSYFLTVAENRNSLFDNVHPNGLGHVLMSRLWHHYLTGNSTLPTRSQLPFVLEGFCLRLTSSACVDPMEYKQNLLEADGDPYYVDETYSLTSIPALLDGGIWISTANADKVNSRGDYLTFNVDRNVDVYIAYDPAATVLPGWMSGFTDTFQTVSVTDPGASTLKLYHKTYVYGVDTPIDGTIQLGGNLASGASGANRNYLVIVKEQ